MVGRMESPVETIASRRATMLNRIPHLMSVARLNGGTYVLLRTGIHPSRYGRGSTRLIRDRLSGNAHFMESIHDRGGTARRSPFHGPPDSTPQLTSLL